MPKRPSSSASSDRAKPHGKQPASKKQKLDQTPVSKRPSSSASSDRAKSRGKQPASKEQERIFSDEAKGFLLKIRPYLLSDLYEANPKRVAGGPGENEEELNGFKKRFWELVQEHTTVKEEEALRFLDADSLLSDWRAVIKCCVDENGIQHTTSANSNTDHFKDEHVVETVNNLFQKLVFSFTETTTLEVRLRAALFLLEGSLQRKFHLGRYLKGIKEEILKIQESNGWGYLFPCPIACAEEQKQALEEIHVDVEEDCPERKEAVQYFDTSRKAAEYALFIGGEIGSGKTHLALNMYTMYKRFFVKSAKTETEKKLYNDTNSHLTVYIKLGVSARAEYEDVKNANKKMQGPIEGPDDEEKQRKMSMARNKDVTDLVCKLMCKAVNIHHPEALERLQRVPDPKAEHGDDPKDPMFHTTFVVLDKVMLIPDVIKACSPSKNVHELLEMIRKRGMQKFFGTIYIVCVDSSPAYYYPSARSFEESVITIQMRPSPNLFDKLTEGK